MTEGLGSSIGGVGRVIGFALVLGLAVVVASSFRTKLRKGKHKFKARATDLAGNVGPGSARAQVKVKKK